MNKEIEREFKIVYAMIVSLEKRQKRILGLFKNLPTEFGE